MRLTRLLPLAAFLSMPLAIKAQFDPRVCADIEDSTARLACYDAAVGAPPADDPPPVPRPPRDPAAPENPEFGLEPKVQEEDVPDTRGLRVAAARHSDFSGWTIEFENGQVWRQIGSDRFDIEVGERYVIRRASFDSFLLGTGDGNRRIRVTRVR